MNSDWLKQLAPEHAPAAPGIWPPAPGWWALLILLLALAALLLYMWRNPRRQRQRAALRELQSIRVRTHTANEVARAIENLLRRYALAASHHAADRECLAQASGRTWLAIAGEHGGTLLSGESGDSLLAAAFGSKARDDRERWFAAAEQYVRASAKKPAAVKPRTPR